MRITTGMVQRNVLVGPQRPLEQAGQDQAAGRLGQADHAPVGRPVQHRARDGPALVAVGATPPTRATSRTPRTGRTRPSPRWTRSPTVRPPRQRPAGPGRAPTPPTRRSRNALADEIDQIIQGVKETANATYGDKYVFSRHGDRHARRTRRAPTTPTRATRAAWTRRSRASLREIGPGVTMAINSVGQEILGDGQAPGDGKLLDTLRTISAGPAGRQRRRAARRRHANLTTNLNQVLDGARPQRRADEPPRGRRLAPRRDHRSVDRSSSRTPRTPTWPRR